MQAGNGVSHVLWHPLTAAMSWMDFGLHLPMMWSLSLSQVRGRESAWDVAEVRNVSFFSAKWVSWEYIPKQQMVWDQSTALGFITQFSTVLVPKQKVWLAWKEHPCGMGTLLLNECGWMGNSGKDWVQNLSWCTFHMMNFPLLKQTKKKRKGTERTWGFFVVELCFTCCVMKWIQLYTADFN